MFKTTSILYCLLLLSCSVLAQTSLIPFGSSWKYLDNGTNQGNNWRTVAFKDTKWKVANGKFGYGISDATTVISFGSNASKKYITTYFRKSISIADPAIYASFTVNVKRDDGAIVYINGKEVYRSNMPTGTVSFTTLAKEAADNGAVPQSFTISASAFAKGNNVVAVEIHQAQANTPDMAFDLELVGSLVPPPVAQYTLTVTTAGSGTVSKSPNQTSYTSGSTVSLTAIPSSGYQFAGWSGDASGTANPLAVTMTSNKTITATFTAVPVQYSLTVSTNGGGTVTKDPDQASYTTGSTIKLTATPASGYQFAGWSGDASGDTNPLTATMDGNKAISATFTVIPDQTPPSVLSINRYSPSTATTDAATLTYRVTFSEPVSGVDRSDFSLITVSGDVTGQLAAGAVAAVGTEGTIYDVTASSVSGSGTIRLDLNSVDTGIANAAGNTISGGYTNGQSYTVEQVPTDQTPPTVLSINRQNPTTENTIATTVTFRATFSEQVKEVDAADFTVTTETGTASGTLTSNAVITAGSDGAAYDVTVSSISGSGTLRLDLKDNGTSITDMAGNALGEGYTSGQTYTIEQAPPEPPASSTLISFKSIWKYLDNGTNQGTTWRATSFNDANWKTGYGKFGYGLSDLSTVVSYGSKASNKYITTYFRKAISLADASIYTYYVAKVNRDDGVVVYINGIEVYRNNMPSAGTVSYTTLASSSSDDDGATPIQFIIPATALTNGTNVVAAEIHQASVTSSDIAFDMELVGETGTPPVEKPMLLYYEGFEKGTGFTGMHMQTSTTYGFMVTDNPTYNEVKVGRWELRAGDPPAANGTRVEVLFSEALAQQETWHSYAGYFPSAEYQIDSDNEVFNQWHQGSTFGTPMLTFSTIDGRFEVRRRSADGSTSTYYTLGPIIYDKWVEVVIHLKQHLTDGFMQIWINGELRLAIKGGATMFDGPYGRWKMGIYKSDWNNGGTTNSIKRVWYVDEVKIGNAVSTYSSMKPTGNNIAVLSMQSSNTQSMLHSHQLTEAQTPLLQIYPTLAKRGTAVTVSTTNPEVNEVYISDVTGRTIYTLKHNSTTSVETMNLPSGMYFVSSSGKQKLTKHKFIVTD